MPYVVSVGIDISKSKFDISVTSRSKVFNIKYFSKSNHHCSFNNTTKGIEKLCRKLSKLNISKNSKVIMESTGDYHLLVAYMLQDKYNTYVINPLISHGVIKTNVRKVKSDKADSLVLSRLGIDNNNLEIKKLNKFKISKNQISKNKLLSFTKCINKHKAALKLSIKNLKETTGKFNITDMNDPIKAMEDIVKQMEQTIDSISRIIEEKIENKVLQKSLANVKGLSLKTASQVISTIEDKTFKTKNSIVSFAGLDISTKESGTFKGRSKLTKRGNEILRAQLFFGAWGLMMHNDKFKEYYEYQKQKGRKYKEILVMIARKLLKMIYGAMKDNNEFNINKFQFNYSK